LTHPNAAGIDIGSASHFVAVPANRCDEPVREFRSFTADLMALADWLTECGIDTAAMESTGVYWIALFELLDARGFTVLLVNARHVKNVTGRKSDVLDCQWLQQLMSYGLLRGAFRPGDAVCALRALVQMNIQLATVIADVAGASGQAILRAIVAGERDGHTLAALCDVRAKAGTEEIAASLQGSWRAEHLFALKQALPPNLTYRAIVSLDTIALKSAATGEKLTLNPGMLVTAEIHQGQRSVLEYLLSPVKKVGQEAARER
jgi:transposase